MENYSEMYLKGKDKIVGLRLAMVKRAEEFSTKASAEYYKTTQKTVGAYLIRNMDLPFIIPTVNKYIKLLGFKQKKLSRKKKKRNLNEVKKEMKSFEKLQVDIKYLDDIPEFYRQYYQLKLPKYQITARCVKTGSLFIGYAREKTNLNTSHRLIEDEFYAYKIFDSKRDFFKKAFGYQTNFNLKRKNSYKENETPAQILSEDIIHRRICLKDDDLMDVNDIYNFKPEIADEYTSIFLKTFKEKMKIKVG